MHVWHGPVSACRKPMKIGEIKIAFTTGLFLGISNSLWPLTKLIRFEYASRNTRREIEHRDWNAVDHSICITFAVKDTFFEFTKSELFIQVIFCVRNDRRFLHKMLIITYGRLISWIYSWYLSNFKIAIPIWIYTCQLKINGSTRQNELNRI